MANYWNKIVQLNVSETIAATPSTLQGTAAILSVGSTLQNTGSLTLIAGAGQLANYLLPATIISNASWSSGLVTITTSTPITFAIGTTIPIVISGMTPDAYNGTFTATVAGANSLTYSLVSNPGTATTFGSLITGYQQSLIAADATWWANGSAAAYYLFEAGAVTRAAALTEIQSYIAANPHTVYAWVLLLGFDSESTLPAFLSQYEALNALVTFYVPCTTSTYASIAATNAREAMATIQSPGAAATEMDVAAYAQFLTAFRPSPTNRLPPSQYTYTYGTTAYSPITNAMMDTLVADNINFISTGAEGGISNTILIKGAMLDGTPANVKYAIDWVQIQLDLALSNAVINGSNNTLNPLYYNQEGINSLQAVARTVAIQAISSGLALGTVNLVQLDPTVFANNVANGLYAGQFVINAVPFNLYVAQNPSNYAQGIYGGFQASFVPQYGFTQIVFNLNATQFA